MYSFEEINQLRKDEFVKVFGNVVEHYPSCAVYLYQKKPFSNVQQLIDGVSEFLVVKLSLQGETESAVLVCYSHCDTKIFHCLLQTEKEC